MKKSSLLKAIAGMLALCLVFPLLAGCIAGAGGKGIALPVPPAARAGGETAAAMPLAAAGGSAKSAPSELFLHVGSPIALSDGKILPLDKENPGIVALVHMNRTLVPLRFVSEFFGADVSYDEPTRTGIVKVGGHVASFPVGKDYFVLDEKQIPLDTQTLVRGGRIMLPLRALCEQVLGLEVDYSKGVIEIAKSAKLTDKTEKDVKSKIGMYVKPSSMDSLTSYLTHYGSTRHGYAYDYDYAEPDAPAPTGTGSQSQASRKDESAKGPQVAESAPPPAPGASLNDDYPDDGYFPSEDYGDSEEAGSGGGGGGDVSHSSTNTQVEGIDESDIIKTDGKYIYLLCQGSIRIVNAVGAMSEVAKIDIGDISLTDMYIDDGRLVVTGTTWSNSYYVDYEIAPPMGQISARSEAGEKLDAPYKNVSMSLVNVYDTSDMSNIQLARSFEIEGTIVTTRKQNGYMYLLSSMYYRYGGGIDPRPLYGENGNICPMPIEDIMIAPGYYAEGFLTLSAINVMDADEDVTSESITAGGYSSTQYMSNSAMYIATNDYINGDGVSIAKFSINGSRIGYAGSGSARGSLNNQFSMDEYRGNLRIATTDWGAGSSSNNLFVLDGNMQICGSVKGFAPGERIYSARFMGARGYVVTFRQTDPLFVFDLSDPANPRITGELKVPGFSTYLHPVSENVILGIGQDVYDIYSRDRNGKETVVGQRTGGVKLSLFDVSDMGLPREIDTLILGDSGYAEVLYNHKAAMFKADEGLLAFCGNIYGDGAGSDGFTGAFLISYAGNVLSERGRIASGQIITNDVGYSKYDDYVAFSGFAGQRLVYIGNTLYYAENRVIRSFDLSTLTLTQSLPLA